MNALTDTPRSYENTETRLANDDAAKKYQSPVGGTSVFVMRTPPDQGTNTQQCPPPPQRRGRGRARRRVVFDKWDVNVLETTAE